MKDSFNLFSFWQSFIHSQESLSPALSQNSFKPPQVIKFYYDVFFFCQYKSLLFTVYPGEEEEKLSIFLMLSGDKLTKE